MIIYLKSLSIVEHIMAWIMANDNRHCVLSEFNVGSEVYQNFFGRELAPAAVGGANHKMLSREEVIIHFVTPAKSPVWRALADGTALFEHDSRH